MAALIVDLLFGVLFLHIALRSSRVAAPLLRLGWDIITAYAADENRSFNVERHRLVATAGRYLTYGAGWAVGSLVSAGASIGLLLSALRAFAG